jgi:two-component system, chemotaxis family, protein-glutamate methylesterase/glutaminase
MNPDKQDSEEWCFLIALAASAGGLRALGMVLAELPLDFPAPILIVQHLEPTRRSMLAEILSRQVLLQVKQAIEGEQLIAGAVYIAPPDRHLLVNPDATLSLSKTELVNYVRPSANLLFESLARSFGKRAIAVVLTGTGSDGSRGAREVKKTGGRVIAQDPATAEYSGMPKAAIDTGSVDHILPLDQIGAALIEMVETGEEGCPNKTIMD